MELHIETSGLVGDRLFINDKHGVTVAEVHLLVRDAAPQITKTVNVHREMLAALKAICDEAVSWHSVHGHGRSSAQCDSICKLIPNMRTAIRNAEKE